MGNGTDLAKQNADIVLSDNKLDSLVNSIRFGRSIFDNVQKFIIYLLSCNNAEVLAMLFCVSYNIDGNIHCYRIYTDI